MNAEAERMIAQLELAPLPREGGFFRRTWTSDERLASGRAAASTIYFLLTPEGFSALHQLQTTEIWHYCAGDPVEHVQLDPRDGSVRLTRLGPDVSADHQPQLVVPGSMWQGARLALSHVEELAPSNGWALVLCTMAPAWDEQEFTLGQREALTRLFPAQAELIKALTR